MNLPISEAKNLYARKGWDLNEAIRWHLANGLVVSDNRSFCLAYPCHSEDIDTPTAPELADCIFVSFLTGSMPHAFAVYGQDFEYIAFQKELSDSSDVRIFNFNRFQSLSDHVKQT